MSLIPLNRNEYAARGIPYFSAAEGFSTGRQYCLIPSSRTMYPIFASSSRSSAMSSLFLACSAFSRAFSSAWAEGGSSGKSGTQRRYRSLKGSPSADHG